MIEWDIALTPGGALEACLEARDEGLVRFIGVTGHGLSVPKMHQRSLARHDFDSVLCPYNFVQMQDERYAQTWTELAAICAERNVALQTIKSLARAPWEGREKTAATWYEPLTDQADIDKAVALGARQPAGLPAHHRRRRRAAEAPRRRRRASRSGRTMTRCDALELTALFT